VTRYTPRRKQGIRLGDHEASTRPACLLLVVYCIAVFLLASPADASRDLPDSLAPTIAGPVAAPADLDRNPPVRLKLPLFSAADIVALSYGYDGPDQLLSPTIGRSSVGHRLFQGLWTDPVTGIAYARNRWYDARTASWLSEDPLGAVDSPNLYAFVGWRPHVGTDPMGLRDPNIVDIKDRERLTALRNQQLKHYERTGILIDITDPTPKELEAYNRAWDATLESFDEAVEDADEDDFLEHRKGKFFASSWWLGKFGSGFHMEEYDVATPLLDAWVGFIGEEMYLIPAAIGLAGSPYVMPGGVQMVERQAMTPAPGRGANNPKTQEAAQTGQEAHRQLEAEAIKEWKPEQRIPLPDGTVVRKDGVSRIDPTKVRIIKPDTPSGRRAAEKRENLMKEHGYETRTDYYDPTDPRFQPGSPTYIGPKKK